MLLLGLSMGFYGDLWGFTGISEGFIGICQDYGYYLGVSINGGTPSRDGFFHGKIQ